MAKRTGCFGVLFAVLAAAGGLAQAQETASQQVGAEPWLGVHLIAPDQREIPLFKEAIDDALRPLGINVVVLEINYGFQFKSHPELGGGGWTREDARDLAAFCKERGIRLIPQLNCLGHQSWDKHTGPLLKKYPQFDETPEIAADNKGIYCRSYCPLHPDVNKVVFALIDELAEAFDADAFHVGMDEVFLIASKQCPRCRGKDPAEVFAKAMNDLHDHIVRDKKLTMLMWADRLIDDKTMHYGEWESSANGTAAAIDKIPKDIIMCDWHYEPMKGYPSVAFFQEKGFRVWPASWRDAKAAKALAEEGRRVNHGKVIGHLGTTWIAANSFLGALAKPGAEPPKQGRKNDAAGAAKALRESLAVWRGPGAAASSADVPPKGQWTSLFNGKDLTGWTPKIQGSALGENYLDTFRVENGVIKVAYDRYTKFKGEFGHLFYKHPFSAYKLRIEYRFVGDQVPGGPGWAFRNSGVMIHCQPPETMRKDQDFPVSIEVQFLGGPGSGSRPTGNLCTPGTHVVMDGKLITQHCTESRSKTYHGDQWVTIEVEAHGNSVIKHFVNGEEVISYEKPQLDGSDPDGKRLAAERNGHMMISGGYLSLQAESHPVEFRKVEIYPLEQ